MTEPAVAAPAVTPAQIFPLGPQAPGMFANHIMLGTDGNAVFITFSQATPVVAPAASGEMQKLQNVPMIAMPVAKVVLMPKMLPQLIENLQTLSHQIEQQQSPQ